jgi:hypothetical protein
MSLGTQNFDGVTAPALPSGLTTIGTFVTAASFTGGSSANCLSYPCTTASTEGKVVLTGVVNTHLDIIRAHRKVFLGTIGTGSGAQGVKVLLTDSTGYDTGGYVGIQIYRDHLGSPFHRTYLYASAGAGTIHLDSGATMLPSNIALDVIVEKQGTTVRISIQRLDDNTYLNSSGSWVSGQTWHYNAVPSTDVPNVDRVQMWLYNADTNGDAGPLKFDDFDDSDLTAMTADTISGSVTGRTATITRTADGANGIGTVTRKLHRGTSVGFTPSGGTEVATNPATPFADPASLANGTYYYKTVRTDGDGNTSTSNEITLVVNVTALDGGTISQTTIGSLQAILSEATAASGGLGAITTQWQFRSPAGTGSYTDVSSGGTTAAGVTITGLTAGATVDVRRRSTDTESTVAYSDVETFTMAAALAGGTIVQGTLTSSSADIDSSGAATGGAGSKTYQLQRRPHGSGSYSDLSGLTGVNPPADTTVSASTSYDYRRKVTDGEGTIAYSNVLQVDVPAPSSGTYTVSPQTLPANHTGNITLTLVGTGTTWDGSTVFTIGNVSGFVKVSQNVTDATHATVVVTTGATTGTGHIDDGSVTDNIAIVNATLTVTPTTATTAVPTSLTLVGANTLWNSETASTLFSSNNGALSNIIVTDDTHATADQTPTAAMTETITDASTTATDTVDVSDPPTQGVSRMRGQALNSVVSNVAVFTIGDPSGVTLYNTLTSTPTVPVFDTIDPNDPPTDMSVYEIPATLWLGKFYNGDYPAGLTGNYRWFLIDRQASALDITDFDPAHLLDWSEVTLLSSVEVGELSGTAVQTALTAQGLTTSRAGKLDRLDENVSAAKTLTTGERDSIATALLKLDWTGITGAASRSVLNALRFLRNKKSISGTTMTVKEEDDTTTAWTATLVTDATAEPITSMDPS